MAFSLKLRDEIFQVNTFPAFLTIYLADSKNFSGLLFSEHRLFAFQIDHQYCLHHIKIFIF